MKKLVSFVVVLAALVLGCYYGMGVLTERTFKKNIDVLNQSNGIVVALETYHRGWFESQAKLHWTLTVPARMIEKNGQSIIEPAKSYMADMPLVIHHGPFIYDNSKLMFGLGYANSQVILPASFDQEFNALYTAESTKPSLDLNVFVSYLNNTDLRLTVPKFKLISKQGNTSFEWLGMTSDVSVTSNRKKISGSLMIDGLSWVKDSIKGVLQNVKSDYDLHRNTAGLYLGDANLSIPSVLIQKENARVIEVNDLDIHSNSLVKKGLFSTSFKLELKNLFLNNKTYNACSGVFAVRNLDATVLADMNMKIAKTQQGSDSDRQRALFSLLPELPNLVNKGAEIELSDLNIGMPNGLIKGNVLISLPNENISNPFQLVQKIKGEGKVTMSMAVFKDLLKESLKRKIEASIAFEKAMAQSAAQTQAMPAETDATKQDATNVATPSPTDVKSTPDLSASDLDQRVSTEADQKIAALVSSGVILTQGGDYVLEFKMIQGQLMINGKTFNPAMVQI